MSDKTKAVIHYILLFLQSLLFLLITLLLLLKFTVFNVSYVKNVLSKNDYYDNLYHEILTEMSYYTNQSGFEDDILNNIITIGEVKFETNSFIEKVYTGKTRNIDTEALNKRLQNNIDAYISKSSFEYVDKKEIDDFIKAIDEVYSDEIKLMGYVEKIAPLFYKLITLSSKLLIIAIVLFVILSIINYLLYKFKNINIILLFTAFSLIFFSIYFKNNIDVKNIFIYSKLMSDIIKYIINNIMFVNTIIIIIYIVIAIIPVVLKKGKKYEAI